MIIGLCRWRTTGSVVMRSWWNLPSNIWRNPNIRDDCFISPWFAFHADELPIFWHVKFEKSPIRSPWFASKSPFEQCSKASVITFCWLVFIGIPSLWILIIPNVLDNNSPLTNHQPTRVLNMWWLVGEKNPMKYPHKKSHFIPVSWWRSSTEFWSLLMGIAYSLSIGKPIKMNTHGYRWL
jgi:hypothetical protein